MSTQGILDFPEDQPPEPPPRRPWTVSQLNHEVRDCLETRIGSVWLEGEISNLRRQPSGHQYFSLKDEAAQVSCVLFRSAAAAAPPLRDGQQVELWGDLSVYEPRGQYQIITRRVQPRGAGELEARLRALQEKLRAEGLFQADRKKPLPPHPVRVGVVTSPAGAAIRDFLQILRRRAPHIAVFVAPVRVQGRGAAAEIAAAVDRFADPTRSGFPPVEVIVVTRGGGSLEDLWEFNEEIVARAIAASPIPVISAVGHEIDITTSDLVADVRAPTPSAAAEILSADRADILQRLVILRQRLQRDAAVHLTQARHRLDLQLASPVFREPLRRIGDWQQRTDELSARSTDAMLARLAHGRSTTERAVSILRARTPTSRLQATARQVRDLLHRQTQAVHTTLERRRQAHAARRHALELLGPRQTLERGFTITTDTAGRPLVAATTAAAENEIITVFADGKVHSHPLPPQ
jgi:exodeoxyribonuclease VII large subunit